jgi:hypothetical protein
LIVQDDGTEIRFISEYNKLIKNLHPLVRGNVCIPVPTQARKDEERFKKLKREEFHFIEDHKLRNAAISWIYAKIHVVEPQRHLAILSALPKPCQYIIAVNAVDGEVNNGRFNQYYFNLSHIMTVAASEALSAIGAFRLAEIAEKADRAYLQIQDTLGNYRENTMKEFMASYEDETNPFHALDMEYYAVSKTEQVDALLLVYIKQHIDCLGD